MVVYGPAGAAAGRLNGPPMLPPEIPSLANYTPEEENVGEEAGQESENVARLFFEAESALDDIAQALPALSTELDDIKSELREVLRKSLEGGSTLRKARERQPRASESAGAGLEGA